MPNRNYEKGVRKERAIVNTAKSEGHVAFRSAGSHSPIDVCIINHRDRKIQLVQAKPDNFSKLDHDRIMQEWRILSGKYDVEFLIV